LDTGEVVFTIEADDDENLGCTSDWDCTAWSSCSGGEQTKTCVDLNDCSENKDETRACTGPIKKEANTDDDTVTTEQTGDDYLAGQPEPADEEQQDVTAEEDTGDSRGVGQATGFLNLSAGKLANLLFVIIGAALLVGLLYKYGWSRRTAPQDVLRGRSNIDLQDYMDMMSRRRR
jgi:hypothetical protein